MSVSADWAGLVNTPLTARELKRLHSSLRPPDLGTGVGSERRIYLLTDTELGESSSERAG